MLVEYIEAAMDRASYEKLKEALEDWLLLKLRDGDAIPASLYLPARTRAPRR